MQYWIDLKVTPKNKYSSNLNKFIDAIVVGNLKHVKEIFSELSDEAADKYKNIETNKYYGSYINNIEGLLVIREEKEISLEITTGGMGPEFSIALVDLLGGFCEKINANVFHDEEDGDIPVKLTYKKGAVYENGRETSLRSFEDEEINSWAVEPIVNKNILKPIHDICKKGNSKTTFLQLTQIYIDLYDPIVSVARPHDLLIETLDGNDKEDYIGYIEHVLSLDYYKNNHQIFTFFKNKMLENLIEMSKTKYLGSLYEEYKKTLVTFYVICDAVNIETEKTFEELVEDINDQDDFDTLYEITAFFDLDYDED